MNKKYLFSLIVTVLLGAFSVLIFFTYVSPLFVYLDRYMEYDSLSYTIFCYSIVVIFSIFVFSICVLQLILMLRKTNFTNYTRLAYEEFKEKRVAKKENKRKSKIEKLQKQLNEIEKDA